MIGAVFILGTAAGFQIFMLVSAMIPLLVWSSDKPSYKLAFIAFNIFAYLYFEFWGLPVNTAITFPETYIKGFKAANTLGFFMTAGLGIWIFQQLYQQKESQLLQQTKKLKNNQLHRDRVCSIIAHDLRSPMSSFSALIEIFLSDYDSLTDTDRKKMLRSMYNSTNSLNSLLDNLLDWSKLISGRYKNRITLLTVAPLINDSLNVLENMIQQKRFTIHVDVDKDLEVFADKHVFLTVLRNLLSNAIKFTSKEGSISLKAEREGHSAKFSVSDTGIGMSPMDINNLFNINLNSHKTGTNQEKGSGLGLLVCKELLETLNSQLEIESEPGKGSVFSFTLDTIHP
jgi:signal transduction histidine kinase